MVREARLTFGTSASCRDASSGTNGELNRLLRYTLVEILQHLKCDSGSILLYDPRTNQLIVSEMIGPNATQLTGFRQSTSQGISGWVAENRKPLLIEDVTKDSRFAAIRNTPRAYSSHSFASVPLLDNDKLIGVVNVSEKRSGNPFDTADLGLLQTLSEKITDSVRSGLAYRDISEKGASLSQKIEEAARQLIKANFELAQMQGFNDNILRSLSLGLLTFDRALRLTYFNEAAGRIFPIGESDISILSLQKLKIGTDDAAWLAILEDCVTQGKVSSIHRVPYTTAGGRQLLLDITCAPLDPGTGEEGGTLVVEDVSRAHQMERRLAQAEQLATLGKLAASVAHELNNPLDGVLRFTSMALQQSSLSPRVAEYLRECKKGLERMARIVRALLEYSRSIGRGLEDLDVNDLIMASVRSLRPLQIRNKVTVKTNFSSEIPKAPFANFAEVFSNIIRNAYEAMPGGGTLSITSKLEEQGVVLTFEDTGSGVSEEVRGKIFEPFFTTKSMSECTGLGLTICSDIVAKSGGVIELENGNGKGALFRLRIPL